MMVITDGPGPPPSPPNLEFLRPTAPPLSPVQPTAPPLPQENNQLPPPPPYNLFSRKDASTETSVAPGEQVMSETEQVIEKEKTEREEVIPDDPLLQCFDVINDVLHMNYQLQKEKEELELQAFNRVYNLDKLADELDAGQVPEILEFYFGGENDNFFTMLLSLSPNSSNANRCTF